MTIPDLHIQSSQALPSGTVTFLFTDIEDSSRLWEQYPEWMRKAMARHDALIESAVEQQHGKIVRPRGEGDSRFAVFSRATDATQAAISIQRLMFIETWKISPIRLRIALHTGEAESRDGDYYGSSVNRCARLRGAAHGGQILLSQTTYFLVRDELPEGSILRDLGEHSLRGFHQPERIFQIVVEGLPGDFPQLSTSGHIHNNLPLELTSFIGRELEISELQYLLSQHRLLTISGVGGAGKTRLAVQVVSNMLDSFPDGVWFIDLAPIRNVDLVSQQVLSLLGMREEAGIVPIQTLLENLKNKSLLLVLDNCEHLLPAIAQLEEKLLRNAPRLRILSTSREKLGVPGEQVWSIRPLRSPKASEEMTLESLLQFEAVKLFHDRANALRPGFFITRENGNAVAQICARLDGIPLAIELAAARVRALSVEEILARLDDRFGLLVGNRTALPRQQTLKTLINWSYELLTKKEQAFLQRLSVFAGSWTLEAAEKVCSGKEIKGSEVLDILTNLIDKSFVIGENHGTHERYRFLETIQKFIQEKLLRSGKAEEFAQKHSEYFLNLAVNSYGKMWGSEQYNWLALLDAELDNLRAALDRLAQNAGQEQKFLEMAGSLWKFWEIRGYLTEGRSRLETALAKDTGASDYLRANGLGGAGHLARQQGDYSRAKTLHEESLTLFRKLGCKLGSARQLNALGEIARFKGNYALSIELNEESLMLRYKIGDKEGIAVSLRQLGLIAYDRGNYYMAREMLDRSLKLVRELGDKLLAAIALNDMGLVAYSLCNYKEAVSRFEEAMSLQREFSDRLGISNSLQNLGNVARDQGDFVRAEKLYKECLSLKEELGEKRGISIVTADLADVAFWQGKYPQAAILAGQSLSLSQELGLKRGISNSFELLGFINYYQGNYEQAASYDQKSFDLAKEIDAPREIGYALVLFALGNYSEGNLVEAEKKFQEAQRIFKKIDDRRSIASTCVNLARTAYRKGDHHTAKQYLDESLMISKELNIRWTQGFVLEIMGLLERSEGNFESALKLFQESLNLAIEQNNQQGMANSFGALAGLAVMAKQPEYATHLFAAAANLRREMGAKMSNSDRLEYENYLDMVHDHLDHSAFEVEWAEGFTMTIHQIIEELEHWSNHFEKSVSMAYAIA